MATNTHSECVIRIAFPRQQQLKVIASVLRYTYTVCIVKCHWLGWYHYVNIEVRLVGFCAREVPWGLRLSYTTVLDDYLVRWYFIYKVFFLI